MYKRPCEEQKELSDVLHGVENKSKTEEKENSSEVINVLPKDKASIHDTSPNNPVLNLQAV